MGMTEKAMEGKKLEEKGFEGKKLKEKVISGEKAADDRNRIAWILLKFSLPLILSGVLQQLYSWADAFIVGNVEGELALAALGATVMVTNFFLMMITGFTAGLSILFAQKFGGGDRAFLAKILSTFSFLLGIIFLGMAAVGIPFAGPLLVLLHTTEDTVLLAESYLRIVLLGLPFLAVYNVYSAALRGIGDSRAPFLAVFISSAVNVLLDILFVAIYGWGVAGAAAATVFSQAAMTVFLVLYAVKKHSVLCFRPGAGSFDKEALAQGVQLGVPPMIQSSVNAFGGLLLQNFMNGFGTQTVAAITTAYRIDSIILLPIINLGSGIATIVAQSYGAGEKKRIGKIFAVGAAMMTVVSIVLSVLVVPTGGKLIALFGISAEAVAIGSEFFRRIACFYLLFGLATAIRGYLEGMGDVVYSSAAGIAALVTRIGASYAMKGWFGNMVIVYAEVVSWGVLLLLYVMRGVWKSRK